MGRGGLGWGLAACVPLLGGMFALRGLKTGPLGRLNRVVDQLVVPLFANCTLFDFALISIVAGFSEELLFRGLIQAALANWLEPTAGLVIASLLFGLAHIITPTYAMLAALIGVYLGWVWIATGNLLAPIVAHGAIRLRGAHLPDSRLARRSVADRKVPGRAWELEKNRGHPRDPRPIMPPRRLPAPAA